MKTYNERTKSILDKVTAKKTAKRRAATIIISVSCCLLLILGLGAVQFLPPDDPAIDTPGEHNENEYYPLITQLRQLTLHASNNKGDIFYGVDLDSAIPEVNIPVSDPVESIPSSSNGTYEEITDNQVQGVTESDLIKRSDRYIYYLRFDSLAVYSIDKENSKALGTYALTDTEDLSYKHYAYDREMYLSQDCSTVTIITSCYSKQLDQRCVSVINLDVTDPNSIVKRSELIITGCYLSSRVIDGEIYLISTYYVDSPNYSDPTTFVPQYGAPENMTTISMEDIIIPQEAASAMYTVIHKLDEKTLDVHGSTALLSYSGKVSVSDKHIFLTRAYQDSQETDECITYETMTQITQLNFELEKIRTFDVRGTINNQYNLDEKDGILRIVTTTETYVHKIAGDGPQDLQFVNANPTNASLYCIDLASGSIRASVENFAPEGESVQSVRFDGDCAYVCTSIVLRDPVFFFDLSDLDNITYKDTGTIPGYSISLVDFADGFLMGIGYGDSFGTLKVEIYREGTTTIESHCKYERACYFSTDYKSYYIDRENQLIGLGIDTYDGSSCYILLHFDGYELVEVLSAKLDGANDTKRAVYIDGYLYMFGDSFHAHGDDFAVEKVM